MLYLLPFELPSQEGEGAQLPFSQISVWVLCSSEGGNCSPD